MVLVKQEAGTVRVLLHVCYRIAAQTRVFCFHLIDIPLPNACVLISLDVAKRVANRVALTVAQIGGCTQFVKQPGRRKTVGAFLLPPA
jgi:hypothetical protein